MGRRGKEFKLAASIKAHILVAVDFECDDHVGLIIRVNPLHPCHPCSIKRNANDANLYE